MCIILPLKNEPLGIKGACSTSILTKNEINLLFRLRDTLNEASSQLHELVNNKKEALEGRREKHDEKSANWLESDKGTEATEKLESDEALISNLEQLVDELANLECLFPGN